jgi:peroxiredoxin (alkyl hydroperoxide reductase subunit C)
VAEIVGCARVTGKVTSEQSPSPDNPQPSSAPDRKEPVMTARVGQKAPDFTAPSYYRGSFTPVKLSDFAGKWILLCFYPGDFTFV